VGVFPRLDDAHRLVVGVLRDRRVLADGGAAEGLCILVAEETMGVAADDDIHSGDLAHPVQIVQVPDVRQKNDLVHTARSQLLDVVGRRGDFLRQGRPGVRRARSFGLGLDVDADDANCLSLKVEDGVVLQFAPQRRRRPRHDVRAQHRSAPTGPVLEVVDEVGQVLVAVVELVVSDDEGVETQGVAHHGRVGLSPK